MVKFMARRYNIGQKILATFRPERFPIKWDRSTGCTAHRKDMLDFFKKDGFVKGRTYGAVVAYYENEKASSMVLRFDPEFRKGLSRVVYAGCYAFSLRAVEDF
jgi:hypothetical protein